MITLINLHLENFMSIELLDLDFNTNETIAIAGENGAGKSTAMAALAFLWSGYRKGDSYKDYIALGCDKAYITHEASIKGEPISFEATIFDRKYGAPVVKKVTYKDQTYTNSEIEDLFKQFDIEYLDQIMFLFQDGNNITDLRPGDRGKLLKHLFHYDFSTQVDELKEQLANENEAYNILSISLSEANKVKIDYLPEEPTLPKNEVKDLLALKEEFISKLSSIHVADQCEDPNSLQTTIDGYEKAVQEKQNRIAANDNRIASLKNTALLPEPAPCTVSQEQLETISKEILSLRRESDILDEKCNDLQEQIIFDTENKKCHYCGHEVSDSYISMVKIDLQSTTELADEKRRDLQRVTEKRAIMQSTMDEWSSADKTWQKSKIDYSHAQEMIKELEKSNSESAAAIETLETALDSLRIRRDAARKTLKEIGPLLEQKHELEKDLKDVEEVLALNERNKIINSERAIQNRKKMEEEKAHKERLEQLQHDISKKLQSIETLKKAVSIFEHEFPNYMVLSTCQHIESYINTCIQKVFPLMQVKLSQSRSGIEFEYSPRGEGWLSVKMSSGAERASLALSWRIAIAKLYGLDTIILDEIDASMTDENSRIIYEFIASLEGFSQIILISHRKAALRAVASLSDNVKCYWVSNGDYQLIEDPEDL